MLATACLVIAPNLHAIPSCGFASNRRLYEWNLLFWAHWVIWVPLRWNPYARCLWFCLTSAHPKDGRVQRLLTSAHDIRTCNGWFLFIQNSTPTLNPFFPSRLSLHTADFWRCSSQASNRFSPPRLTSKVFHILYFFFFLAVGYFFALSFLLSLCSDSNCFSSPYLISRYFLLSLSLRFCCWVFFYPNFFLKWEAFFAVFLFNGRINSQKI